MAKKRQFSLKSTIFLELFLDIYNLQSGNLTLSKIVIGYFLKISYFLKYDNSLFLQMINLYGFEIRLFNIDWQSDVSPVD